MGEEEEINVSFQGKECKILFCFFLRALFWRAEFPDVVLSTERVVMAWVSKQYTLMRREESRKQTVLLVVWCVQTAGSAPCGKRSVGPIA